MAFVPYVPPTRQKPISPQAQELANRIRTLIGEYRGYYPQLSKRDVRDALRVAGESDSSASPSRPLAATLLGGVAAGLGVIVALRMAGGTDTSRITAPLIVALVIVAVGVLLLARNR